jgi:hypothetical protein
MKEVRCEGPNRSIERIASKCSYLPKRVGLEKSVKERKGTGPIIANYKG